MNIRTLPQEIISVFSILLHKELLFCRIGAGEGSPILPSEEEDTIHANVENWRESVLVTTFIVKWSTKGERGQNVQKTLYMVYE